MTLSALISKWRERGHKYGFCHGAFVECASELEPIAAAIESELTALRSERDELLRALADLENCGLLEEDPAFDEGANTALRVANRLLEKQP